MTIPTFQSKEHSNEFALSFQEKALTYTTFMGIVKDLMYGTGSGNFANLPGTCQEVIRDITNSILYDVEYEFKDAHPEYKNDEDEMFIPRRTFKENVEEALLAANKKFWNNSNDTMATLPTVE